MSPLSDNSEFLPAGWRIELLKDVLQKTTSVDPRKTPDDEFEYIDVSSVSRTTFSIDKTTRLKGIDAPSRARRHVKSGDVIFATIRPTLQRVAVVPNNLNEQVCSTGYFILRPKPELYNRFVYYYLFTESFMSEMERRQKGASYPAVNDGDVREQVISFPPLLEQNRIVAVLDEAFASISQAVANAEKNLVNARELFESYLNNVFTQKGDGWVEKNLGELGKVSMCKRILKKQTSASGDIPFYKIGTFGKKPNAFISNDIYQDFKEKYSFPKEGDILISASGTIGRRVIYDGMPAYFQDSNIVWIDNDEKMVLNEYLYQFYGVCDWNPSKGATISRLYNDDLRRIKISFPSISEQKKLIGKMQNLNDQTKNLETIYQHKITALTELKQSILQKAFTGELSVDTAKQVVNG